MQDHWDDMCISNIPQHAAYLFQGTDSAIRFINEETYVWEALSPSIPGSITKERHKNTESFCVSRWALDKFPLKLAFGADFGYLFSPMDLKVLEQVLIAATKRLQDVTHGKISFQLITANDKADLVIKFRRCDQALMSHARPIYGKNKEITHVQSVVYVEKNFRHDKVILELLHNLLHALGVYGHSTVQTDTAYKEWTPHQQLLTARDIQTLELLYRCPIGLSRRDLELMWQEYQKKHLSLSLHPDLDSFIKRLTDQSALKLPNSVFDKSRGLSAQETALKESFNLYLQQIRHA